MALNGVSIKLDKERKLKFTLNSISEFDEQCKKPFFELVTNMAEADSQGKQFPLKMGELRDLFWAGLIHEDATLSRTQVGDILEIYLEENELADLIEKLAAALSESTLFKTKDKEKKISKTMKKTDEG